MSTDLPEAAPRVKPFASGNARAHDASDVDVILTESGGAASRGAGTAVAGVPVAAASVTAGAPAWPQAGMATPRSTHSRLMTS